MLYGNTIIITEDGLYCRAGRELIPDVSKALEYKKRVAVRNQFGTSMKIKPAYMIDRRSGLFLRGLVLRVMEYLNKRKIKFELVISDEQDNMGNCQSPKLRDIELREDQAKLLAPVISLRRGVIVSPTGSGKTILALGVVSMWPNARSLIVTHRVDILKQFVERAERYLPDHKVQVLKSGEPITGQLICSTIQTLHSFSLGAVIDKFDMIICDECHHVSERTGIWASFLNKNLAPIKIGFTATLPTDREKLLTMEGSLGPVIGELSVQDSLDMGIITKPFVTLVPISYNSELGEERNYKKIYNKGIVHNRARNYRIIRTAKERAKEGKTSLILIKEIPHGENLRTIARHANLNVIFVHGSTEGASRKSAKDALQDKKVDAVICTDVWREGIDIPSLDCIIMAYGGKSKLQTIQGVGRGLRKFEGKENVEIIDFLDPYKYLAQHTIERLQTYVEKGWLNK